MTQALSKAQVTCLLFSVLWFPSKVFAPSLGVSYKRWSNSPLHSLDKGHFLSKNKRGGKEHVDMYSMWMKSACAKIPAHHLLTDKGPDKGQVSVPLFLICNMGIRIPITKN